MAMAMLCLVWRLVMFFSSQSEVFEVRARGFWRTIILLFNASASLMMSSICSGVEFSGAVMVGMGSWCWVMSLLRYSES